MIEPRGTRGRFTRTRGPETMWILAALAASCLGALPDRAGAAPAAAPPPAALPPPAADPELARALLEEDGAVRAERVREILGPGDDRCRVLAAFTGYPAERVRENAVRALDDLECRSFQHYAGFMKDRSPWVAEALLRAAEDHLLVEAVPFLIERLDDPRRVIDGGSVRTLGEDAHRVLRTLTCRFLGYDPSGTPAERAAAAARWRRWYEEHRGEPRSTWVAQGIAQAEAVLAGESAGLRVEALRQLALIGLPAVPALRAALRRAPGDLSAAALCSSEEPPLVTDTLDCRLLVQNTTDRRLALVPAAEVALSVSPLIPPGSATGPAAKEGAARRGKATGKDPGPGRTADAAPDAAGPRATEPPRPAPPGDAGVRALAEELVDLAPGEILSRPFKVGPVPGAGRYTVRVVLPDRADLIFEASGSPPGPAASRPALEGTTEVRFEQ